MSNETVLWSVDPRGVATLTLNRPEVNNAYDDALVQGLHDASGSSRSTPQSAAAPRRPKGSPRSPRSGPRAGEECMLE